MARTRSRKRTGAAIAVSLLSHLALILPLAMLIPHLKSATVARNAPIELDLRQQSRPSELKAASPASGSAGSSPAVANRPPAADRPPRSDSAPDPASARVGATQGVSASGAPPQVGSGAPAVGEAAGRVRQALQRLGGCTDSALLSQDELEACRHDRRQQYAVGEAMRMDALPSAKRADYDHARDVCDKVYTYSGLDTDPDHSAKAPQVYGNTC